MIEHLPKYIGHEDFYSFHYYKNPEFLKPVSDKIQRQTDKPVVLQEFGLPTTGEEGKELEDQKRKYQKTLEVARREGFDGMMFWELNDHPEEALKGNPYNPKNDFVDDFGILKDDYSKKPAAHVVEQYYKWNL